MLRKPSLLPWLLIGSYLLSAPLTTQADAAQACGKPSNAPAFFLAPPRTAKPVESSVPLLGSNILYNLEDAATWRAGLPQKLAKLELASLRFPGGEVADSYDWETGRAEVPGRNNNTQQLVDVFQFLDYAATAGVRDIYYVVNLEGAFLAAGKLEDNITRQAEKAARLVAAVHQRGYRIANWEIGNESYHQATRYPLTAQEYAKALRQFALAMRRADPTIRILANGPGDINSQGFADRIGDTQLDSLRNTPKQLCPGLQRAECVDNLNKSQKRTPGNAGWWETLAREAPDAFDDIAIHTYAPAAQLAGQQDAFAETERLIKLRHYLSKQTGRSVGIAITEWNVPPLQIETPADETILGNAVKFGTLKAAGVQSAIFWPLRSPSEGESGRALLSLNGARETSLYQAMQLVNSATRGSFIAQERPTEGVYALHTKDGNEQAILLVNADSAAKTLEIPELSRGKTFVVRQLDALDNASTKTLCNGKASGAKLAVEIAPRSITAIRIGN